MINAIIYTLLNGFVFNVVLPIWAVLISLGLG